jgi:hypothetical protein
MIVLATTDVAGLKVDVDQLCSHSVGEQETFVFGGGNNATPPFPVTQVHLLRSGQTLDVVQQLIQTRSLKNCLALLN